MMTKMTKMYACVPNLHDSTYQGPKTPYTYRFCIYDPR